MALNLLARFFGDTTPLVRSLQGVKGPADKAGSDAGKAFGSQFKSVVLRFIGAGAIISQVQKVMQEAVKIESNATREGIGVEAMQELQRAAELTGLTIKELQETAPMVAKEFVAMMDSIKTGGGFLDKDTVQQLSDAAFELNRFVSSAAPLVTWLLQAANLLIRATKSGVAGLFSRAYYTAGSIFGSDLLKTQGQIAQEDADRIWNDNGQNRPAERMAVEKFMGARRSALTQRAAFAGSLAEGLPQAGQALSTASQMVPFGGSAISQIVEAIEKSNTKLEQVRDSIESKL